MKRFNHRIRYLMRSNPEYFNFKKLHEFNATLLHVKLIVKDAMMYCCISFK